MTGFGLGITAPSKRSTFPINGVDSRPPPEPTPEGALLVGQGIEIKGGIQACEILVIEGRVEADLAVKTLDIKAGGAFSGEAKVESAHIAGSYEGSLTVSGRLTVGETGVVRGTLRYATLSVAAGGVVAGDIDRQD